MHPYVDFKSRPAKTNDFVFRPLRTNSKGGKSGHVGLKDSSSGAVRDMVLQTTKERCPWGVSSLTGDDGTEKYSLDVAINDPELHQFMTTLDEAILKQAAENSEEWFGKTLTPDVIRVR